jgi:hypothetical protein
MAGQRKSSPFVQAIPARETLLRSGLTGTPRPATMPSMNFLNPHVILLNWWRR